MWKQKISKQRQTGNNAATEHRCESCMFVNGMGGPWTFICLQTNVFEECLQSHAKICKDHVPTAFVDYNPPTLGEASLCGRSGRPKYGIHSKQMSSKLFFWLHSLPQNWSKYIIIRWKSRQLHPRQPNKLHLIFLFWFLSHVACWTIEGIWDSRLNVVGTFPNRPNIPGMWKQKISKQRLQLNIVVKAACLWTAWGVHGRSSVCRQMSLRNISNPMQRYAKIMFQRPL